MNRNKIVGEKIKSIREAKNISIEELSERSGLSLTQIESIEQSTSFPSLAPLIKIARVLSCRLGTFLDDNNELGPAITRKGDRNSAISFSNNTTGNHRHMEYYALSKDKSERHMEPFIIDVQSGEEGEEFILSSHEGEEFIFCLRGIIEISYGKNTYVLEEGDSIYYDSIVAHHVHAFDKEGAKILAVVYTPF